MKLSTLYQQLLGDTKTKTLKKTFCGKDILVTGGCGSIGNEIVKQLLHYKPKKIKVFDNNESGLFYLQERFKSPLIRILVGDVRDKERLKFAIRGTDIIFHAAALKHVPLCEFNPFEAVGTNVIGTQNLVEVAREEGVGEFIAISTDKAVNPINTMGATKLLAEKIVLTAELGKCYTKFSCVRFGNVLNSVASVIPIFKQQIKDGGPVTITSPKMVRFFMSMPEAVSLVLQTAKLSKGGEIFVLKMRKIRIIDLAEVVIERLAPLYGRRPEDIKMKFIGIRPGEKLDEFLVTEEERPYLYHIDERLAVLKIPRAIVYHPSAPGYLKPNPNPPDLNKAPLLTKEEIRSVINRLGLVP